MPKTIEINTTQNVVIDYELASLRERIIAFFLDLLAVSLGSFLLVTLLGRLFGSGGMMGMFIGSLPLLFFFLYHFLLEILNSGQSIGKLILGLKVVRLDGREPKWGDALLRSFFHIIDSIFSLGFVGSLLIKSNPNSQRYGDMAANTTVIKIQASTLIIGLSDVLSIISLDNYQPSFPQVQTLSENDMLQIQSAISRYQTLANQAHHELIEDLVTHLMELLSITERPKNSIGFLKTLLKDYIVLTR